MKKQFDFEAQPFEVDSKYDELGGEFSEAEVDSLFSEFEAGNDESDYETAATNRCPAFNPVAVENPGGGRVKDKRIPRRADIVSVKGAFHPGVPLHRLTAAALKALVCAARADGIKSPLLLPTGSRSGFRDPKQQAQAWQRALKKYGSPEKANKWVAKPGSSAHQSGRAIDFYLGASNSSGNVGTLRTTPAYKWMVANASRFGFYPYPNEPWHWEYNPPASGQSELFSGKYDELEFERIHEAESESDGYLEIGGQTSVAPPPLVRSESLPPAQTFYVRIPLGVEKPAAPITGIHIPQNFQAHPQVDLIVYLHGIKPRANLAMDQYWNTKYFPYWPLREQLNASRKNAILVGPTLGPRSQGQTGWLAKPGGLDRYLDKVLAALTAYGPYQNATPRIGSIVLACHSGGGRPMRELALAQNKCARKIKECWGFDCTYFDDDPTGWPRWARARQDAKLYLYYRPGSPTQLRAKKIQSLKIPNVYVLTSSVEHNRVPIKHWQERLAGATFLSQTGSASTENELSPSFLNSGFETAFEDGENDESEGEDTEAFDTELADEEWEDEFRRFGRMPGRAPQAQIRSGPRRRPPQRQALPSQRPRRPIQHLIRRPLRSPKRLARLAGRGRLPIDSIQDVPNAEPAEQRSEYVRWVQSSLNQVLGLRLPITGIMNAAARSALRTFQGQKNLPVDGIAGPETRKALLEAKAKPSGRGDEPSQSGATREPSSSTPGDEPSPSGPSEEPSSSGASQEPPTPEPSTEEPAQTEEFEWLGTDEYEGADEVWDEALDFSAETNEVGMSRPSNAAAKGPNIVRVRGIRVARQIAPRVQALLAAAQADGIGLGGWGYRSHESQIELRRRHCGPTDYDIYQKPSSQCSPPTATPGKSMHEKGLAIDITYGGKTIKSRTSPAFQWLAKNAGRFGLFNLPSEPWHWSVNGK
jgi:LAS superfamily LD-carboxypeptidase LdcB